MKVNAANRNVAENMVKDLCEAARNLRNAAVAAKSLGSGTAAQKTHDSLWMQNLKIQMRADQIDRAIRRFDAMVKIACEDAARYADAK